MVKKLLLVAGSAGLLVACGSDDYTQVQAHQIDSIVNVKGKQRDAANAAKNDSTLKAIEMEKAEAITKERMNEMKKNEKTPVTVPATTPSITIHTPDTLKNSR